MQPNKPTGRSSQFSKQLGELDNSREKDSINKHEKALDRQERKDKYLKTKENYSKVKESMKTPKRCERCGKFTVDSDALFCSMECIQADKVETLAILNKEEDDIVY